MAKKSLDKQVKELNSRDSLKKVKQLIKEKKQFKKSELVPGNLIFTSYIAKDKEMMYDKTPLILILRKNRLHTLGLAFHWVPFNMRINLIKHIIKLNKRNIEKNKPLEFSYEQVKPYLKSTGYAPMIRLYINARLGKSGVVIPPERLLEVARLNAHTFTGGKYPPEQMRRVAKTNNKK